MVRGAFANPRIKNLLAPGTEGGVTIHQPSGDKMTIYEASMRYQKDGVPLFVFGGEAKEVTVKADDTEFQARVRIDTPKEVDYFKHGGILQFVLRQLMADDA